MDASSHWCGHIKSKVMLRLLMRNTNWATFCVDWVLIIIILYIHLQKWVDRPQPRHNTHKSSKIKSKHRTVVNVHCITACLLCLCAVWLCCSMHQLHHVTLFTDDLSVVNVSILFCVSCGYIRLVHLLTYTSCKQVPGTYFSRNKVV